jgi:hypothetical protein
MILSGENYDMIRTRTTIIEYWYGTTRHTVRYDKIRTASDRPTIQYTHVRQTPHSTYDPRFVLYFLREYSTVRYDTNHEQYNAMHTANCAQYDTTWYEPRVIVLQYNTYMNGKPRTVHMNHSSYCISPGSTDKVWYEQRECRLQTVIFYLRSTRFSSTHKGFSLYDLWFVLYFLGA